MEAFMDYQYVSFDVFDTLIQRSVAKPTDLFLLMENHLSHIHPEISDGFAIKRQNAERKGNENAGRHIGLREIYDRLRSEYGDYTDELMELEIRMELRGCQPKPVCVDWFNRCIVNGKTVLLISDMYLPSSVIAKMLEKCGIHGYQKLYVSCECGAWKKDGTLFKLVLDEWKILPDQLVHIGDNKRSDVIAPFKLGIRAIWKRNGQKRLCRIPKAIKAEDELSYRTLRACIRNCSQGMTEYEKMGCELFGPQLYGFTVWLAEQLKNSEIHDAYFMARDGYMLKRAFDEMEVEGVRTHYFYCSRRAFQLPLLRDSKGFQDTKFLFWQRKRITIRRFLSQLGLDPDEYKELAGDFGLDVDHIYLIEDFVDSAEIGRFYDSIRKTVTDNAETEYEALIEYFQSLHMQKKVAVIDIGFFGTIQKSLDTYIAESYPGMTTYGYYFNLSNKAQDIYKINASGYHCSNIENNLLFEAQFLAQQGSLKRFIKRDDGSISPEFEEFEYEDNAQKLIDEVGVISQYQKGALKFIKYMQEAVPADTLTVNYDLAIHDFNRLRKSPSLKEASFWGRFRYINFTTGYLANPRSVFYYIIHPQKLRSDIHSCGWQIGFMKRLFVLPLPYERILFILKGLLEKR